MRNAYNTTSPVVGNGGLSDFTGLQAIGAKTQLYQHSSHSKMTFAASPLVILSCRAVRAA